MARINIEDSLWSDDTFLRYLIKVGDEEKAIGAFSLAVKLAQKYWCPDRGLVPVEKWNQSSSRTAMIEFGLAEVRDGGVYLKGSDEQFAWWFQKAEAGKKGGRPKKTGNRKKAVGIRAVSDDKRSITESNRVEPSSSFSSSSSSSNTEELFPSEIGEQLPAVADSPKIPATRKSKYSDLTREKMHAFIKAYAEAFKTKYGGTPEGIRQPELIDKIGKWIEHVSQERAVNLIQVYMQVDHRPINDSCHDLWQFFRNLNRIGIALDSGQDAGQINWGQVFG